ncbi:MAG: RluA family pseudouridine synthase, partial [Treponema sp.]|nr:RluA family pseudouridine synthase [Treponema sp.]
MGTKTPGFHTVKASTAYKREHKADYGRERIEILYEDQDIIVINKPSGMLSVPYPGSKSRTALDTIEKILRGRGAWTKSHRPFVVHRLDRDTSGVMVFALNETAQKRIIAQWHGGQTHKVYRAVAENPSGRQGGGQGAHPGNGRGDQPQLPETGTIDQPLAENAYHVAYVPDSGDERRSKAVRAVTHYRIVMQGPTHTLFELTLDTGKKNQIRAHFSFLGRPLAGDENYRARTDPFHRLALHARRLEFPHPATGKRMCFEVPEDEAWLEYVEKGDLHPQAPSWEEERAVRHREACMPASVPRLNRRASARDKAHG